MKRSWIAVILVLCLGLSGMGIAVWQKSAAKPVLEGPGVSMDNTDFAYYYWSEFFYFSEVFGEYLQDQVDFKKPLADQSCGDGLTWEDYLIETTLETVRDTTIMVQEAESVGFVLPESYDSQYQQQLISFADAATRAGCKDLEAYLRDSYGRRATVEGFSHYLYDTHLAAAYADHLLEEIVISDEAVEREFADHQADYEGVYGYDPDTPEQWTEAIREELRTAEYQNAFREIQSRRGNGFRVNRERLKLTPPKGLYEGQ